jgi:hypothetical protein
MNELQIDFVVTWLDSSDPEWQKSLALYSPNSKGHKESARFRSTDFFMYWFRAVERYAPWVHKVYLVTNGKYPDWINKDCPKLELVKHADFIPAEYLPTFNCRTIELHLHKIKGLSEHFVYFNDDMLLNAPVKPDYYFRNGLPCDINNETFLNVPIYTPKDKFGNYISMLADIGVINRHFDRRETFRQSPKRWFWPHLKIKGMIVSTILLDKKLFIGFSNYHTEQTFLKSVYEEIWEKEPDVLKAACTRFREDNTVNNYIFRYWQLAKNLFYPLRRKSTFFFLIERDVVKQIEETLLKEKSISICMNDSSLCTEENYIYINKELQKLFEKKYPEKSSFEI